MNNQHRATEGEWYCIKARDSGKLNVAYSGIHELLCRIEALEAAAKPAESNYPAKPDSSLVERVEDAIYRNGNEPGFRAEARAAILEVAAWFGEQGGAIALGWAMRLEKEAKQ